jgi:hypothetical protein
MWVIAVLIWSLSLSSFCWADSFRCGRKLIRTGDSASTVLQRCGEPQLKDKGQEKIRSPGGTEKVLVKRWHYKNSARSLQRVVLIYQGKVVAIKTGPR